MYPARHHLAQKKRKNCTYGYSELYGLAPRQMADGSLWFFHWVENWHSLVVNVTYYRDRIRKNSTKWFAKQLEATSFLEPSRTIYISMLMTSFSIWSFKWHSFNVEVKCLILPFCWYQDHAVWLWSLMKKIRCLSSLFKQTSHLDVLLYCDWMVIAFPRCSTPMSSPWFCVCSVAPLTHNLTLPHYPHGLFCVETVTIQFCGNKECTHEITFISINNS